MSVPLNASLLASKSVFVSLAFCHLSRISSALTLTPFSGVVKGDSRLAMIDGNGLSQSCNVFSERGRRWANCRPDLLDVVKRWRLPEESRNPIPVSPHRQEFFAGGVRESLADLPPSSDG